VQKWEQLAAALITAGFKVSWQAGFDDLYGYMEWIHSCALIITTDSLGLHLALALRKRVVGLFGPTDPKEIFFYNRGQYLISPAKCSHMPCYGEQCVLQGESCMDQIKTIEIIAKVKDLWPAA
jgi:heptosyltransferase II